MTTTTPTVSRRRATDTDDRVVTIRDINSLWPSPENETLYKPIDPKDPAIKKLGKSLKKLGFLHPIGVSEDGWIVDGHRRFAAAQVAGIEEVPCYTVPIRRLLDDYSVNPEFLPTLREYNRQRVKSVDELLREVVVESDPEEAYQALIEQRTANENDLPDAIKIRKGKPRVRVSKGKQLMLAAVLAVLRQFKNVLPISERKIHYELAQHHKPPLHSSRPSVLYGLDDKSYHALTKLLTSARCEGSIPWESIGDDTRPVTLWRVYDHAQEFFSQQMDGFFKGYRRNLQQSQPDYIEVTGEKMTAGPVIKPIAGIYSIPVVLGRGFCSLRPSLRHGTTIQKKRQEAADRATRHRF